MSKKIKEIVLANPRGFCAGVDRAIDIVEKSLEKYDEPVFVRHQVVHNKKVVESLEKKGVKFVKEISEIPDNAVAIFSAHGVSSEVEDEAKQAADSYSDVEHVEVQGGLLGMDQHTPPPAPAILSKEERRSEESGYIRPLRRRI